MTTQPKPRTSRAKKTDTTQTPAPVVETQQPTLEEQPQQPEQEKFASPDELVPSLTKEVQDGPKEELVLAKGIKIKAAPKQLEQIKAIDVEGFLASKYMLSPEGYSPKLKAIIQFMETYTDAMRKGTPVDAKTGANRQYRLLQMIRGALDAQTSDALINFDTILYFVNQNKVTVFNERLAARFYNLLPEHEVNPFLSVITLLLKTASPRERQAGLGSIQLKDIEKAFNSEQQVTNFYAFFAKNG